MARVHTCADGGTGDRRWRFTNLSAAGDAGGLDRHGPSLRKKLPSKHTLRDILNRMNYRLKR